MEKVITQSLFSSQAAPRRTWQSYATSGAVHIVFVTLLFLISFPAVQNVVNPGRHATLISPVLPKFKPKVVPQPSERHPLVLRQEAMKVLPLKIPPPVVKPPEPKPQLLAKAPEIKEQAPVIQQIPEVKLAPPAPPKPEVKTGTFESTEQAKGPRVPNQLKVGGFGDPNGVPPSDKSKSATLTMASVGGFDMPNGAANGGGGGRAQSGSVRASGFGSVGDPNGVAGGTGTHGSVRTGGFGDSTVAQAKSPGSGIQPAAPSTTPVEILFKPKPVYTQEAKTLRLEGQVSLQVVFSAEGSVKVLRVLRGLGHGLDEAAEQAATQVRFRPATRGGSPVDTNATIYITFQLT